MSYSVKIKLDPKKHGCKKPNLVKVRAILSWDTPPPSATPGQPPVWGNVLERWIQIGKRDYVLGDITKAVDFGMLQISPDGQQPGRWLRQWTERQRRLHRA